MPRAFTNGWSWLGDNLTIGPAFWANCWFYRLLTVSWVSSILLVFWVWRGQTSILSMPQLIILEQICSEIAGDAAKFVVWHLNNRKISDFGHKFCWIHIEWVLHWDNIRTLSSVVVVPTHYKMSYTFSGRVDCSIAPDKTQCKGKSIIVTGGMFVKCWEKSFWLCCFKQHFFSILEKAD